MSIRRKKFYTQIRDGSQYYYTQDSPQNFHQRMNSQRNKTENFTIQKSKQKQLSKQSQKVFQREQKQQNKKQRLSRAVKEYLKVYKDNAYERQLKGRKYNSLQKEIWIENMSQSKPKKSKCMKIQYVPYKLHSKDKANHVWETYNEDLQPTSHTSKRKIKKTNTKDRTLIFPKIQQRQEEIAPKKRNTSYQQLLTEKNPFPIEQSLPYDEITPKKNPKEMFKDSKEHFYVFEKACKLQTYFAKNRKTQRYQSQTQNQFLQLLVTQIVTKLPTKQKVNQYISNYKVQNQEINIEELKKRNNYKVKLIEKGPQAFLYFGQTKQGLKEGLGVLITSKCIQQGIFEKDYLVSGLEKKKAGVYRGQFFNGKRQGEGSCYWTNGQQYQGEWKNNKKHGNGYWKAKNLDTYIGQWKQNNADGFGIYKKNNGQIYEGEFKKFQKHGKGKETFPNGDRFEGNYTQGEATGKGKYTWCNGVIYQGNFLNGQCQGIGTLKYPKSFEYEGSFMRGGPSGISRLKLSNGNIYNGMFKEGKISGYGRMDNRQKNQTKQGYWNDNEIISQIN